MFPDYKDIKWVEWIEPFGPHNEPVFCRVRPDVAIECSKAAAKKANPSFVYQNDQTAFEDFIITYWASTIPKPAPLETGSEPK